MSEQPQVLPLLKAAPIRVTGRVKWFDPLKGWGFLYSSEIDADILLYQQIAIQGGYANIKEGATIICDVVQRPKGMEAVRLVSVHDGKAC